MTARRTLAVVAAIFMMLTAGCAGWGEDGPVGDDDPEPDEADDLEDAQGDEQEQESDSNEAGSDTGVDADEGDTGNATESDESNGDSEAQPPDEESEDTGVDDSAQDTDDSEEATDDSATDDESTEQESPDYSLEESTDDSESADGDDEGSDASGEDESEPAENGDSDSDEDTSTNGDTDAPDENGDDSEANGGNGDDDGGDADNGDSDTNDDGDTDQNGDADNGDTDANGNGDDDDLETSQLEVHAGEASAVEGASITVTGESETEQYDGETWTGETNADGIATFDVPDGEYQVHGTDNSGGEETQYVTVDGDTSVLLGGLAPPVPDEHDVTIQVVDEANDERLEGATIVAMGEYHPATGEAGFGGETDSDGEVSTTAYAGGYDVTVDHEAYDTYHGSTLVEGDTEITVGLDTDRDEMYEQTLTVTVVDEAGEPVEGQEVEAGPPEGEIDTGVTDANGEVVFTSVTSVPSDSTMTEIRVNEQTIPSSYHVDGVEETVEIETDEDEGSEENGENGPDDDGEPSDEPALVV